MSKKDAIQTAINRASLMQNVDNDVAKALQLAEIHPKLAEIIMTMHHQAKAQDDEIKELRKNMLQLAQTLERSVDSTAAVMEIAAELRGRLGKDQVNPEPM
jgi:ethanolamine utilization microcompartment shell protein EutL